MAREQRQTHRVGQWASSSTFSLGPVTVLEESEFWFDIIGNRAFHSLAYAGMHLIATKIF
jgi:hypothetical protein